MGQLWERDTFSTRTIKMLRPFKHKSFSSITRTKYTCISAMLVYNELCAISIFVSDAQLQITNAAIPRVCIVFHSAC